MKKQSILSLITLFALGLFVPIVANAADSKLDKADEAFVMKAAQGGMVEVMLGELAKEKGKKEDVKKFGERMVTDHTKANDELKRWPLRRASLFPIRSTSSTRRLSLRCPRWKARISTRHMSPIW